jgi:hypothetical protein
VKRLVNKILDSGFIAGLIPILIYAIIMFGFLGMVILLIKITS